MLSEVAIVPGRLSMCSFVWRLKGKRVRLHDMGNLQLNTSVTSGSVLSEIRTNFLRFHPRL